MLGTITEFRLSSTDPDAFDYDAKAQVAAYVDLVAEPTPTRRPRPRRCTRLSIALAAIARRQRPRMRRARHGSTRATAYLKTEAFLFYAGPVDGPGGPFPRLNGWPVDPPRSTASSPTRRIAELPRASRGSTAIEPPVKITTGLHVLEYLLWGEDGALTRRCICGRRRRAARRLRQGAGAALRQRSAVVTAAWAPGANNYRASVEAMDQRNALGRAFNGMTVLLGYEVPLRRIGAGLFPANENFQPSPFSNTSADDMRRAFEGAQAVYFEHRARRAARRADRRRARRQGRRRLRARRGGARARSTHLTSASSRPPRAAPSAPRPKPR